MNASDVPVWVGAGGFAALLAAAAAVLRWAVRFMVEAAENANARQATEIGRLERRLREEEQRCDRLEGEVQTLKRQLAEWIEGKP